MMEVLLLSDSWLIKSNLFLMGILLLSFGLRNRISAAFRHLIWMIGFLGMLLIPLLSNIIWQSDSSIYIPIASTYKQPTIESAVPEKPVDILNNPPIDVKHNSINQKEYKALFPTLDWSYWIYMIWFLGITILLFKLIIEKCLLRLLRYKSQTRHFGLNERLHQLQHKINFKRLVHIAISTHVDAPFTTGWIQPIIYVPENFVQFEPQKQEFVFLHELAHIQRWDWLSTFLTQLTCAIFWFNPLVWFAAKRSKIDMEKACDDMVIGASNQKYDYASLMLDVIEASNDHPLKMQHHLALANKSELKSRMLAILDDTTNRKKVGKSTLLMTIVLVILFLMPIAAFQIIKKTPVTTTIDINSYLGVLKSGTDEERKYAAWVLGTSEKVETANDLIMQLNHKNPEVRIMTLWALGELKAPNIIDALLKMTQDSVDLVREMAVKSIGELENPSTIHGVNTLLQDKSEGVRVAAVWALGEIKTIESIEMVINALNDSSLAVKKMAVKVLGTAPPQIALPKLANILDSQDVHLKLSTITALDLMRTSATAPLLTKALQDENASIRMNAAEALGHLGHKSAVNVLMPLLEDSSIEVRGMAVWALDELKL